MSDPATWQNWDDIPVHYRAFVIHTLQQIESADDLDQHDQCMARTFQLAGERLLAGAN